MPSLPEAATETGIAKRFAPLRRNASTKAPEAKEPTLKPFRATLPWKEPQRGENTLLSLSQAASAAGIAKSTIWRAIKSGRMSASRSETGGYQVDAAELFRAFPKADKNAAMKQDATAIKRAAAMALEAQISALKDVSSLLREQLEDVRKDRDAWRAQAETNQRLLVDARPHRRFFGWGAKI
jgi:predicted DNA-binding transcriptional regulator AlpA